MKLPLKRFRYAVGETALLVVEIIFTRMPLWLNRAFFDCLYFASYPIIAVVPGFRKMIVKNLKIALGNELSKREIRRLARRVMRNIIRMPGYILFYGSPNNLDKLKRDVKISGIEHLTEALKKGRGVIGLGAHMTGFLVLTVRLANSEIPFVVPTKDPRNQLLKKKLRGWRDISGVRYIDVDSPDKGKEEIMKALAANKLVYLIADERKKRDGTPVPFFGKDALTAVGPAVFSMKTGAPIVPIFIATRNEGIVIDILPPLPAVSGDGENAVRELTIRANQAIEDYIRKYPDQWAWNQQRWRM